MSILGFVGSQLKHAKRYNEIIGVLVKYGFDDLVAQIQVKGRYSFFKKLVPKKRYERVVALTKWQKMRMVCEELGPSFVKLGQILSNRPDLLPADLIIELEKLQDAVPPFPGAKAKSIVEQELRQPTDNIFQSFSEEPFASASLAQVHKAVLKDGSKVVLKIQRPNIKKVIQEDINIMISIAETLEKHFPAIKNLDPVELVRSYEDTINKELDFIHESINIQRFQSNFSGNPEIYVPKIYREYITDKVLTMEFIDGIKVSNSKLLNDNGFDRELIAQRSIKAFLDQVFKHGFFHADPHAGNMLILQNNVVCFIDFGMMGNILKKDIIQISDMITAIESKNVHKIIHALQRFSDDAVVKNTKHLEYDLYEFVNNYSVQMLNGTELSTMFLELKDIVIQHNIKVPTHFFLLTRAIVSIEGVTRQLAPKLDLVKILRPYMIELLTKKFNPIQFFKKIFNATYEFGSYIEDMPQDIKQTIRKIKNGEIKVDLEHKAIDPLIHTVNRISKQLVAAIIVSALIIGSSLLIVANMQPLWGNTSVLGILGLCLAAIIGAGMVRDLQKKDPGY